MFFTTDITDTGFARHGSAQMGGNQSVSSVSAIGGIRAISGKGGGAGFTTEHTERPKAVTEYTKNSVTCEAQKFSVNGRNGARPSRRHMVLRA